MSENTNVPMKLSEAIRLGSMLHGQAFGDLSAERRKWHIGRFQFGPKVKETCALGGAFEATGGTLVTRVNDQSQPLQLYGRDGYNGSVPVGGTYTIMESPFAATFNIRASCPSCPAALMVAQMVPHLNDSHRWTREAIADWVETIEQAQSSALVPRSAENKEEELFAMVSK